MMFLAFGWIVIKSSEEEYVGLDIESADKLDETLKEKDQALMQTMETWLKEKVPTNSNFRYQFTQYLNNHSGLFQFHTSRNHRCLFTQECLDFITQQSNGSYGLVHIHDDENSEFEFEVWRILNGEVSNHKDTYFSPFNSTCAFGGTNFWNSQDA